MAVGLSPESWALLALCGVFLGLASSLLRDRARLPSHAAARDPLATPWRARRSPAPVAIATALALLVPLSIAGLQPLTKTERRHVAWLSPAILAGAFFGASLVPLIPGPWLLAGFAVTAVIALLRPPAAITLTLAVTPPRRRAQPFAAILKSAVSSPVWHWLASFGRHGVRESGLDPDAGSRRDGSASHRNSGL